MSHQVVSSSRIPSCDAIFENIHSRKRLPFSSQQSLTSIFAQIPVSSFPQVPGGKVQILSEHNIMAAPVTTPEAGVTPDWRERYLGIIDYSALIFWVLESVELAVAHSDQVLQQLLEWEQVLLGVGAVALGATGPIAVAGLTIAAISAAVAGGLAAENGMAEDGPTPADNMGKDSYENILQEEAFKSAMVKSVVMSYRWAPFLPVALGSSMITVLLLLSKYGLRNIPATEVGNSCIKILLPSLQLFKVSSNAREAIGLIA